MKIIATSLIAVLTVLFFANGIESESSTIVGDIIIKNTNGTLYCDSMICPPDAVACHVTKRNHPYDYSQIVRNRKCFAINGAIIGEQTIYEPNIYQGDVNINVVSGGGSPNIVHRQLTPEEQRELDETLRRTQEHIQTQLGNLYETLRPLQDGSFAANLQNRIETEVHDSLKNALNF